MVDSKKAARFFSDVLTEAAKVSGSAIAASASSLAYRVNAKYILVGTKTGNTAKLVSSFRPSSKIVAIVHDEQTRNQLALAWGVESVLVEPNKDIEQFIANAVENLRSSFNVEINDKIVIIVGATPGISGETDTIKVLTYK